MAIDIAIVNSPGVGDFCPIPTAQRITDLVTICKEAGYIGMVVGNPGVGKTTTLEHFARNNNGAYLCTMSPAIRNMTGALSVVCKAIGATPERATWETHEIICHQLKWRDGERVLLIDEAQHLPNNVIDELRCIHDETGLGLVFCGNKEFHDRFNRARAAAFAQLTSRVGMRLEIWEPTDDDIDAIRRHHGIEGKAEHAFLVKHAKTSGGLRSVTKLIKVGRALAGPGNPIRLEHLKAAAAMQGME